MELWIRSQDREDLIEVHSVEVGIVGIKDKIKIITLINANTKIDLGIYKSKERALEVLDEIQEAMMLNEDYDYSGRVEVNTIRKCLIYEMPKD